MLPFVGSYTKYRGVADSFIEIFTDNCRRLSAGMGSILTMAIAIARSRGTITGRGSSIALVWRSSIASSIDW